MQNLKFYYKQGFWGGCFKGAVSYLQLLPVAQFEQNHRAYEGMQCFKYAYCCKMALNSDRWFLYTCSAQAVVYTFTLAVSQIQ